MKNWLRQRLILFTTEFERSATQRYFAGWLWRGAIPPVATGRSPAVAAVHRTCQASHRHTLPELTSETRHQSRDITGTLARPASLMLPD